MFRSATDLHQGAHLFLVKITELKMQNLHASPHQTPRKNITCYAAALPHSHV
jgi:hypothetical protein